MSYWQRALVVLGVAVVLVALAVKAFVAGASSSRAVDVTERSEQTL